MPLTALEAKTSEIKQPMKTPIMLPIASCHKLDSLRQQKSVLSQFLGCMHRNTRV